MYRCDACAFECSKQSGLQRHEKTKKHAVAAALRERTCLRCGKQYQTQSGLWKHDKTCGSDQRYDQRYDQGYDQSNDQGYDQSNDQSNDQGYEKTQCLLDELKEQQAQIVQLLSKQQHNYYQSTTNVLVLLEKDCGNAPNWLDFVKSLSIRLENDLTESIIKTMCAGIEALGAQRRPIHCLDVDRKVYLKTNDAWESDAVKIQGAFRESNEFLQTRCVKMIQAWDDTHPEWYHKEEKVEEYRKLAVQITEGVDAEGWTKAITQKCLKTLTV